MSKTVEFYFDYGSPYTYFAAMRIEELAARTGAEIVWKPMLLGAIFKALGVMAPATNAARVQYMWADLARWSKRLDIPIRFPAMFPLNSLQPARMTLALEGRPEHVPFIKAAFGAYWVDGRDIGRPEVLQSVAGDLGLDGAALFAAAQNQEIKDRLRAQNEEAVARGVFGAPSFFVGDELFWGNDRLDFVEEALKA